MRISVIMPVLNEERILGESLSSVLSLGFDEVIVVDGSSRDRTRDIVASLQVRGPELISGPAYRSSNLDPRTSALMLLTTLPSRAGQMNAGAAISQGEVLVFLHADTQLPLNARMQIERALRDPAYVGGRFDVQFEPATELGRIISRMMNWRSRWSGIATGDQAIFVRRQCFERHGSGCHHKTQYIEALLQSCHQIPLQRRNDRGAA